MQLTLITGAARSGKSSFAQKIASEKARHFKKAGVIYLATALVGDAEMQRRVELHQQSRPHEWKTVEEPYDLASAVKNIPCQNLLIIDCLTVWLTNLIFLYLDQEKESWTEVGDSWDKTAIFNDQPFLQSKEAELEKHIIQKVNHFLNTLNQTSLTCIMVTNEVGWGIVPEHYSGRIFRDLAGRTNQQVAARAKEVYLVTAGIPLKIKG